MKTFLTTMIVFGGCLGMAIAAEPEKLTPAAASTWLAATPGAKILDVRTKEEYSTGCLLQSVLIPWTDKDFITRAAKELDPSKPLLVYCRSGRRSAEAAAALVKIGFIDVRNVEGGILAWEKAKQPIIKPE